MTEAFFSLVWGIVLAFIFSWPMAIVGCGVAPFMVVGSFLQQKADQEMYFDDDTRKSSDDKKGDASSKEAEVLVSDCVINNKTVASFGNDNILMDEYWSHLAKRTANEAKQGRNFGLTWGISQFVINFIFGVLYFAMGELLYGWPDLEVMQSDNMFIAMFCLMFGAFSAGQAMQFGPDVQKAK